MKKERKNVKTEHSKKQLTGVYCFGIGTAHHILGGKHKLEV